MGLVVRNGRSAGTGAIRDGHPRERASDYNRHTIPPINRLPVQESDGAYLFRRKLNHGAVTENRVRRIDERLPGLMTEPNYAVPVVAVVVTHARPRLATLVVRSLINDEESIQSVWSWLSMGTEGSTTVLWRGKFKRCGSRKTPARLEVLQRESATSLRTSTWRGSIYPKTT